MLARFTRRRRRPRRLGNYDRFAQRVAVRLRSLAASTAATASAVLWAVGRCARVGACGQPYSSPPGRAGPGRAIDKGQHGRVTTAATRFQLTRRARRHAGRVRMRCTGSDSATARPLGSSFISAASEPLEERSRLIGK